MSSRVRCIAEASFYELRVARIDVISDDVVEWSSNDDVFRDFRAYEDNISAKEFREYETFSVK